MAALGGAEGRRRARGVGWQDGVTPALVVLEMKLRETIEHCRRHVLRGGREDGKTGGRKAAREGGREEGRGEGGRQGGREEKRACDREGGVGSCEAARADTYRQFEDTHE